MSDIDIRRTGRAGRITIRRPKALNALTYPMIPAIAEALNEWQQDDKVALIVIDAEGDRAFCAGGDITVLYEAGRKGDFAFGHRFWRDEYRLNAQIAEYPKPIASFMQGFTMGGGVGIGCHASHRVVGDTSRIAMPECGIGLIPDVGGSLLLANAPGRLGEYLGLTGARMGPGDAIHAGFADHFIAEDGWPELISALEETGDTSVIEPAARARPRSAIRDAQTEIDILFAGTTLTEFGTALAATATDIAKTAAKALARNAPLSMACTLELLARNRASPTIHAALSEEYRFTARATEKGDFLEGIRAAIIDKDRAPRWKHELNTVTAGDVAEMLAPLGDNDLIWEQNT